MLKSPLTSVLNTHLQYFLFHFFRTRREKEEWLAALFEAIKELYQRKSSLKIGREILRPCDSEIGKKQPHILKLEAIHKCMECAQPFSMMRKKYNCRACGVVSSFFITYLRPYRAILKKSRWQRNSSKNPIRILVTTAVSSSQIRGHLKK